MEERKSRRGRVSGANGRRRPAAPHSWAPRELERPDAGDQREHAHAHSRTNTSRARTLCGLHSIDRVERFPSDICARFSASVRIVF